NGREVEGGLPGRPLEVEGAFVYRVERLPLEPGTNRLKVEAGAGATGEASATVTYVRGAGDGLLDGLELGDRAGAAAWPLGEGLPSSRVLLHGRVEWPALGDESLGRPMRVRVWVNDFEQFDTALLPAEGRVRKFRASLRLNRKTNRVKL